MAVDSKKLNWMISKNGISGTMVFSIIDEIMLMYSILKLDLIIPLKHQRNPGGDWIYSVGLAVQDLSGTFGSGSGLSDVFF